ncbi:MAG: histidinol-phosphate transaminase [Anaerolineae bacterium]|nr:histidinol-phosphate transaminase [Gloeobacterales cyanobacterium ES-bin-313]
MLELFRPEVQALVAYHTPAVPGADKLNENEWPTDLPDAFKQKLAQTLEQEILANRYPSANPERLKAGIADYCGVTPSHVALGNGSDELIRAIITATCVGGQGAVLSAEPTFSMYRILAETFGVPYVGLERRENDFSFDPDTLRDAVRKHHVRVVFLANPNSPTATLLSEQILETLRSLPVITVLDEAYFEFSGFTSVPLIETWPNLIILRTFSKAFRLASFRVGYAIAQSEVAQLLEKVRLPYNLSAISQAAATLAIENRDVLLAEVPALLQGRHRLVESLSPWLRIWPSAANFFYARCPNWDLETLRLALAEQGSLIRVTGGGMRISVGTPAQNQRLIDNFARVLGKASNSN